MEHGTAGQVRDTLTHLLLHSAMLAVSFSDHFSVGCNSVDISSSESFQPCKDCYMYLHLHVACGSRLHDQYFAAIQSAGFCSLCEIKMDVRDITHLVPIKKKTSVVAARIFLTGCFLVARTEAGIMELSFCSWKQLSWYAERTRVHHAWSNEDCFGQPVLVQSTESIVPNYHLVHMVQA